LQESIICNDFTIPASSTSITLITGTARPINLNRHFSTNLIRIRITHWDWFVVIAFGIIFVPAFEILVTVLAFCAIEFLYFPHGITRTIFQLP